MNTSGLHDENHYSTVREIALILQAALENETCAEILSAENYRASETEQHPDGLAMTNKFLYRVHHEYALNGAEITAAKTERVDGRFLHRGPYCALYEILRQRRS